VRGNITVTRKVRGRRAPSRRIGIAVGDVGRDARPRERPDADGRVGPLHRVDTAAGVVEPGAVRLRRGRVDAAPGVVALARGVDVAVRRLHGSREARVVDGAAIAGVEGHGVVGLLVDTFNDIDLAVIRPVGADGPARGVRLPL
jgi:hypothetical protein